MSIVSSVQQRRNEIMVERHYDHLGNEHTQVWTIPSDWAQAQIDAAVAAHAAQIEVGLADAEFQALAQ